MTTSTPALLRLACATALLVAGSHARAADWSEGLFDPSLGANTRNHSFGKLAGGTKLGPAREATPQLGWQFGHSWAGSPATGALQMNRMQIVSGPRLDVAWPEAAGQFSVSLLAVKELAGGAGVRPFSFDTAPRLATQWAFTLPNEAVFKGWASVTGAKGRDIFGQQSRPETWLEASLMFDLGASSGKPKAVYGGFGFQYIHNKFGAPAALPGRKTATPQLKLEAQF